MFIMFPVILQVLKNMCQNLDNPPKSGKNMKNIYIVLPEVHCKSAFNYHAVTPDCLAPNLDPHVSKMFEILASDTNVTSNYIYILLWKPRMALWFASSTN